MNHASFHYTRYSWQEIYSTYPYSLLFLLSLVLSRHFLFEQLNQDLRFEHDHSHLKEDFLVSYLCKEIEWKIINIIFVNWDYSCTANYSWLSKKRSLVIYTFQLQKNVRTQLTVIIEIFLPVCPPDKIMVRTLMSSSNSMTFLDFFHDLRFAVTFKIFQNFPRFRAFLWHKTVRQTWTLVSTKIHAINPV